MFSDTFIERLSEASHITALSGAGASAESGVPTFRDPDGLWQKVDAGKMATLEGFRGDPITVQSWYAARRRTALSVEPHAGHYALAELERIASRFSLITQNVDGLHARAGNRNLIEIHGSLLEYECVSCGQECPPLETTLDDDEPAFCACGGLVRPSVVWFGEMLDPARLERAWSAASDCDVFLSIGTGAEVYPAAELPLLAKRNGAFVVEINPGPTAISPVVDESIKGPAGKVLPALVEKLAQVN